MVAPLNREETVYAAVLAGEIEIDQEGRVWRLASRFGNRWTSKTWTRFHQARRAENDTGQYLQVRVMWDNRRMHALAHRLVFRHFHGPIPVGMTVNHKNGKKKDNRPENLELATYSEQAMHAVRVLRRGRAADQKGEKNHAHTLSDREVVEIRRRRATGERLAAIAEDYGVAFQTISKIALGQRR